jgi:hypothetical protein
MERDTLFLLKHRFVDGPGTAFYCPECSEVNGLLHYHPELRHSVDVRYVDFQRPRPEVIARVGEANQSCPVLVLAAGSPGDGPEVKRAEGQGTRFVSGSRDIGNHWANRFGTSRPH